MKLNAADIEIIMDTMKHSLHFANWIGFYKLEARQGVVNKLLRVMEKIEFDIIESKESE